jgi:hypothetical protein
MGNKKVPAQPVAQPSKPKDVPVIQVSAPPKQTTSSSSKQSKGKKDSAIPLSQRMVDLLFSQWYLIYLFTVTFTDLHNFTASYLGVEVKDLEHMDLVYPPKFLTNLYFKWARTVDPLLYNNPMWWQVMEWVNLLVLAPFSLFAIVGFLRGWNWMRMPAIITSSFTFYSLLLCIGCALYGETPTPDSMMFVAIYVPYLIFPALVVMRMWSEKPFNKAQGWLMSIFLTVSCLATYALFGAYTIKWFRMYEGDMLPPAVRAWLDTTFPLAY